MHKDIHKFIVEVPNRNEKSEIDYSLINNEMWDHIKNTTVERDVEIGRDHYLIRIQLRTRRREDINIKRKVPNYKIKCFKLKESEIERFFLDTRQGTEKKQKDKCGKHVYTCRKWKRL